MCLYLCNLLELWGRVGHQADVQVRGFEQQSKSSWTSSSGGSRGGAAWRQVFHLLENWWRLPVGYVLITMVSLQIKISL